MRLTAWLLFALAAFGSVPALAQDAGGGRQYLSIDYHAFPTFGAALKNSLAPTDFRANTGAVLKNSLDPLNPARYVAAVILVQAQRQLASGQGLDLGKIVGSLSPGGLALGYVGGQAGELMGAGVQSILANVAGPVGGLAGFAMRPILWYLGSSMGQDVGSGLQHGEFAPSKGMARALLDFNPVRDSSQMIGDGLGAVVGQALIPIPLVGGMVGGAIGGTIGLLAGKAFVGTESGRRVDEAVRRKLHNLARSFDPAAREAAPCPAAPGPGAPTSMPPPTAADLGSPRARAAYQGLLDALKAGDQKKVDSAYGELQKARAGAP
ncbi:MAG: hypothetical protein HY303_09875 [Candidatus Wallbacteria bacterium]|nr:hypothetical protein [Candidatus Wallbacteria bacterium]